jgi:hypothetical protein
MFRVRYELSIDINLLRNSVFEGLIYHRHKLLDLIEFIIHNTSPILSYTVKIKLSW